MKRRTFLATTITSTAIAGLLSFASVAQADPSSSRKGGHKYSQMTDEQKAEHMAKRLDRYAKKLGLTDEQKTKIQALKTNSKNAIKPLREEQRALRTELRALDPSAADYTAKVADVANRQAALTSQMTIARGNQRKEMASILTTEQLAQQKELRASRKGKRGGKRHHRKHGNKQQS